VAGKVSNTALKIVTKINFFTYTPFFIFPRILIKSRVSVVVEYINNGQQ